MFKSRTRTAIILACIPTIFAFSSSLWAKAALTSSQKKAKDKCIGKFIDDYINCIKEHPQLSVNDCAKAAYAGYEVCLKAAGLSLAENPPPPLPKHRPPTGPTPSGISPGSPSPGKPKPDTRASVAPALAGPTASPSPGKFNLGDLFKPRTSASAASPSPAAASTSEAATNPPAPGGGHGLVWVNTQMHVYHREGSRFYGTTKKGKYMTEAEAAKEGNRAAGKGE
jgi:hypothetical protein